jgi:hypothetical protein
VDSPKKMKQNTSMSRVLVLNLLLQALFAVATPWADENRADETRADEKTPAEAVAPTNIEGTWLLDIPMPNGLEKTSLKIKQRGSDFKATLKGKHGSSRVKNFRIEGSSFAFSQAVPTPTGEIDMNFRGSIRGDRIQGVIELPMSIIPFSGSRRSY